MDAGWHPVRRRNTPETVMISGVWSLVAGVGFEPRPLDYEPKEARLTQRNIRVSKARRFLRSLSGAWSRTYLLPLLQADSQSGGPAPTLTTVGQPDSTVRRAPPRGPPKTPPPPR